MVYFSNQSIKRVALALLVALSIFAVTNCGSDTAEISETEVISNDETGSGLSITDVWSRQPAQGQNMSAIYAVVNNPTDKDITITDVVTSISDRIELHETLMNDGVMSMEHRPEGFTVPAKGQFLFEPGGPHVMVFDIDPDNYPQEFDVTFIYDGGSVEVKGETRSIAGDDPHAHHDHSHHDHGDHDHSGHDHGDHGDHGDHDHGDHDHGDKEKGD